jgi:hypothetical protein
VIKVADVEVILAALAAGGGEVARTAVVDAYAGLRDLLRRRLGGDRALEASSEVLRGELIESGADRDEEILAAARRVLEATTTINVHDAKGVQIGDHNTQHNTFN